MKFFSQTLFCICLSTLLSAQDKHFTQFYASPQTLNPALAGGFEGKYRVGVVYRDQWRKVVEYPFQTFALGADLRFIPFETGSAKDAVGVGILFFTDRVKGIDFSTNQIALTGAYHKSLNQNNTQFLSLGFQAALNQRNVNYDKLTFQDQFNGTDGFNLATFEDLPANNFAFSDFSFGLNYSATNKKGYALFAGMAMHHAFSPQVTFYDQEKKNGNSPLHRKYSAQLSGQIPLAERVSLLPRFLIAKQGPHMEMNVGTNVRFFLNDYSPVGFHLGAWVRPVRNEDSAVGIDAIVGLVGVEINNVLIGFSYDANLRDLTTFHQGQGAFELSIAYLGSYDNETILCPKF